MTPTSLAASVAPRTGKIHVFERGENLLQNGIVRNRIIKLEFTQSKNELLV